MAEPNPPVVKRSEWINAALAATFVLFWGLLGTMFGPYWDFIGFYNGATIASQGDFAHLHFHERQEAAQRQALPNWNGTIIHFMRPQVYALVLAPLAWLPYKAAFTVWILFQSSILLACLVWGWKRFGPESVVFASLWPVACLGIAFGQDASLYLGLAVLSYELFTRNKPGWSGALLGLICLKPHLVILLPFAMLIQKRGRMLSGFVLAGAAEGLASVALGGWTSIQRYLDFVSSPDNHMLPERMVHIYAWLTNLGLATPWQIRAGMAVLVLGAVWLVCRTGNWTYGMAAAAFGSYLIAPHTYPYDMAMLLLPAWICLQMVGNRSLRIATALFLSPIPIALQLLDQPWAVAPAAVLTVLLGLLAWNFRFSKAKAASAGLSAPSSALAG